MCLVDDQDDSKARGLPCGLWSMVEITASSTLQVESAGQTRRSLCEKAEFTFENEHLRRQLQRSISATQGPLKYVGVVGFDTLKT